MNAAYDAGRIALMLNELRLPTIGQLWPDFAERSDKESWQASRLLGALLEHELAERAKRRIERHRTESHLDLTKTLATFDFGVAPMVSKAHVMALATGDSWLEKGATILLFGPPGGGKSHLGSAIGHALIDAGYRVLFTRTGEIVQKLQVARQSLQLPSALAKLDRFAALAAPTVNASRLTIIAVSAAGVCGIGVSFFSSVFGYSRQVAAMANDHELPNFLGRLSQRNVPVFALVVPSTIGMLVALSGKLDQLIVLMVFAGAIPYLTIFAIYWPSSARPHVGETISCSSRDCGCRTWAGARRFDFLSVHRGGFGVVASWCIDAFNSTHISTLHLTSGSAESFVFTVSSLLLISLDRE
ncbi:ATP-binding protein [Paraburkholderia sp. SIMBA_030]|uniref:ATP-binding protein n=1 Tax=Paraburkholderia sp. SIMBA_030 TaxID=3085773 RepID=UPI00397E8CE1